MEHARQYMPIGDLISLDWNKQGDEWLARFEQVLAEHDSGIRMTGFTNDDTTKPCIDVKTANPDIPAAQWILSLAVIEQGFLLLIAQDRIDETPAKVVDAWLDAAKEATESLGKNYPKHNWSAIIGPAPSRMSTVRVGVDSEGLATSGRLGGMRFSSGGRFLLERVQNPQNPSFYGFQGSGSVPIVVRGSTRGYAWESASKLAARDLNRACAILSIAWGVCMVIRESPAPVEWGIRTVPDRPVGAQPDDTQQVPTNPVVDREIPDWAESAFHDINKRVRIANAVAAFHEGFKVETMHPSWALVAFIASVEAISQTIFYDDKCTKCGTHRHIGARFRERCASLYLTIKWKSLGSCIRLVQERSMRVDCTDSKKLSAPWAWNSSLGMISTSSCGRTSFRCEKPLVRS